MFIALGLVARCPLRRRTGAVLLAMAPLVDVVLLVVTAVHLCGGAVADWQHALAALYIGFALGFGHRLVRWADVRFAHRFAGGPVPVRPSGRAAVRASWRDVGRTLPAAGVSAAIAGALTWLAGDADRTAAPAALYPALGLICAVQLLWAVVVTVRARPAQAEVATPVAGSASGRSMIGG